MSFETLKLWNYETSKLWNSESSKLWKFEALELWFLFAMKGIPTTPQHSDSHHCTSPHCLRRQIVSETLSIELFFIISSNSFHASPRLLSIKMVVFRDVLRTTNVFLGTMQKRSWRSFRFLWWEIFDISGCHVWKQTKCNSSKKVIKGLLLYCPAIRRLVESKKRVWKCHSPWKANNK